MPSQTLDPSLLSQYDPNQQGPPQQLRDTFGGGNNW